MTDFIVLRDRSTLPTRSPLDINNLSSISAERAHSPEPELEVARDATKADIADLAAAQGTIAIAPVFPTRLIEPETHVASPGGSRNSTVPWGLDAVGASTSSMTGNGVTVAVLDTGIDANHQAFSQVSINERDFSGAGNGDVNGHGTHCAGTIFGGAVNGMQIGVAPNIERAYVGKVLDDNGSGGSDWLFSAIQWAADQKVDVLSMSLGFDFPGLVARLVDMGRPVQAATSIALQGYRANLRMFDSLMEMYRARMAFGKGTVVVAAAGNESNRPNYEVAVSIPAAANGIISVGALANTPAGLQPAYFSNTFPIISAPGVGVRSAQAGGGLADLDGTSMACPHVAGVACLWWQSLRQAGFNQPNAAGVISRMRASARTDVFAPNIDPSDCGEGLVTAPA